MFVLSENTHQNGPNKFLLWVFRFFGYLLVPVWVWGQPVAMQRGATTWLTTCEICGSETRHCQKFEMKSVRVKPGPTQKIRGSRRPKVRRHELNYLLTFSKLIRSVNRGCDMDYENEHDGDHGLNEGSNSFQDSFAGFMYADPDRNWRRRSPLTRTRDVYSYSLYFDIG